MRCPRCGTSTEVKEKRGVFRDRHCTNPACLLDFTTCECVMAHREDERLCARTRETHGKILPRAAVVAANLAPSAGFLSEHSPAVKGWLERRGTANPAAGPMSERLPAC